MTNIASVIAMRGLPRRSGRDVAASRARDLLCPPPRIQPPGAGLIRWAPPGDLFAA